MDGTTNSVNSVPMIMPLTSMIPMLLRAPAPGPFARTSGKCPITVAAAVNFSKDAATVPPGADAPPKPETRVVVFGDSDFASNAAIGFSGNKDLFMNTVGWLSQQENLISIRPREASDRRITLTATQQNWIVATAMLFVPGFVFAAGILNWLRRRG
mgnify:CR=1 FL=1